MKFYEKNAEFMHTGGSRTEILPSYELLEKDCHVIAKGTKYDAWNDGL